jgi:adenylate cyclase
VTIRESRPFTIIALLVIAMFGALQFFGIPEFARLEFAASDLLVRHAEPLPVDPSLVFLAIDDTSVQLDPELDVAQLLGPTPSAEERRGLTLMAESPFPWSREVYAAVIERLVGAGARVVALDLTFPKSREGDDVLAAALAKYRDHVVIAGNFEESLSRVNETTYRFTPPAESILSSAERAKNSPAFVNFWPESDGVIRQTLPYQTLPTVRGYPHDKMAGEPIYPSFAARIAQQAGHPVTAAPGEEKRLRFAARNAFSPIPIFQLFSPRFWTNNFQQGAFFQDKIVVIGAFGNWQQDQHATPLATIPGPALQLHAVNSLLHGVLHQPPLALQTGLVIFAGLLALGLARVVGHPLWRLGGLIAGAAAWAGSAIFLLGTWQLLIPTAAPLGAWGVIGLGGVVFDTLFAALEKSRFRRMLERYVSKNVVGEMVRDRQGFNNMLGGAVRPATILFSDIRNFTSFSALTDAKLLVAQLNEYFTAMVECVFRHGGTVDKFMGDALMAVWGNVADITPEEGAQSAMRCALDMAESLEALNRTWMEAGRSQLRIGIALNHGDVVCGNIGSPHRMEFTVIGDAVNVAWRLQEATKLHPGAILLGENMQAFVPRNFATIPGGEVRVAEMLDVTYFQLLGPGNCAPEPVETRRPAHAIA